jgi:hypothetical protein
MKTEPKTELKIIPHNFIEPSESLEETVSNLERCGGNLNTFLTADCQYGQSELERMFQIEKQLNESANKEFKKRWQKALKISAKIRMDLIRCKAFEILESYENKSSSSSATDISFAKAMLIGVLVEDSEMVKSKYRPIPSTLGQGTQSTAESQDDAIGDLEDDFENAKD